MKYPQDEFTLEQLIAKLKTMNLKTSFEIPWRDKVLRFDCRNGNVILLNEAEALLSRQA